MPTVTARASLIGTATASGLGLPIKYLHHRKTVCSKVDRELKENQKKAFINIHRKSFFHDPILLRGRNFEILRHLVTNLILAYMWLFNKYLLN